MKWLASLILGIVVVANLAQAEERCLDGACFQKTIESRSGSLKLIGTATFTYLWLDVYTIALYRPSDFRSLDVASGDKPEVLEFYYHRSIEADEFGKAAWKALRKNPSFNEKVLGEQVKYFNGLYTSVEEGDRYTLEYLPSKGTALVQRGKQLGLVKGPNFAKYYFGIWLSKYALSQRLRDDLIEDIEQSVH